MRPAIIILAICFTYSVCSAKKLEMNLDNIHALLKEDSKEDTIRKYFSNAFHSRPATFFKQGNLLISAFFSNNLAVNHDHVIAKIPELSSLTHPPPGIFAKETNRYAGAYAVPIFDLPGS